MLRNMIRMTLCLSLICCVLQPFRAATSSQRDRPAGREVWWRL